MNSSKLTHATATLKRQSCQVSPEAMAEYQLRQAAFNATLARIHEKWGTKPLAH